MRQHGFAATYRHDRCRCDNCRAAHNQRQNRYRVTLAGQQQRSREVARRTLKSAMQRAEVLY